MLPCSLQPCASPQVGAPRLLRLKFPLCRHPTVQRVSGEAEQQLARAGALVHKGDLNLPGVPSAEQKTIPPSLEQTEPHTEGHRPWLLTGEALAAACKLDFQLIDYDWPLFPLP